jgi:hypothetical protein
MLCEPGKPMIDLVDSAELAQRENRRAPRTTWQGRPRWVLRAVHGTYRGGADLPTSATPCA